MSEEIDKIRRLAGITEMETQKALMKKDPIANRIWNQVRDAMEAAESVEGGPEGEAYVRLMKSIAEEALGRAKRAASWYHQEAHTASTEYKD